MAWDCDTIIVAVAVIGAIGSLSGWGTVILQKQREKKRNPNLTVSGVAILHPRGESDLLSVRLEILNTGEISTSVLSAIGFIDSEKIVNFRGKGATSETPIELVPHKEKKWHADYEKVKPGSKGKFFLFKIKCDPPNKTEEFKIQIT